MQENYSHDGGIPFVNDRRIAFGFELNRQMRDVGRSLLYGHRGVYAQLVEHLEGTLSPFLDDTYRAKLRYFVDEVKATLVGQKKMVLQDEKTIEHVEFELAKRKYKALMDLMSRHGFLPLPLFEDEINPTSSNEYIDA